MSLEKSTISHYEVFEQLGGGGMGVVYQARDTKLGREVALKFLPAELSRDPDANERFMVEAKAASALNHPNVCTIYEVGEADDGRLFIAMAFYDGATLKYQAADGRMPAGEAIRIARQIADALSAAHEKGIIHRDIKPANIMVTRRGHAILLDFGLAKLPGFLSLTQTGSTLGTAAYMSPEQVQGHEVDHRTDLWSLGVVLYEMLAGKRPFAGDYEQAMAYGIVNAEPERIEDVSDEVWTVVQRLLAKNPDERFESADEVLTALASLTDSSTTTAAVSLAAAKSSRSNRLIAGLTALVLGAAGFGWWLLASGSGNAEAAARVDPNLIAVMPFTVRGDAQLDYLEQGLVELFSLSFDGAGELKTVDPNALLGTVAKEDVTIVSPTEAVTLAARLGAGKALVGTVSRFGERIQVSASLYDDGGNILMQETADAVSEDQIPTAVQAATQAMLNNMLGERRGDLIEVAAATTQSFPALKAYLGGARALRKGLWEDAIKHFSEAVRADSTFALAWNGLGDAYGWIGPTDSADAAGEKAYRYRHQLPARQRLVFEAGYEGFVLGETDRALALFRDVLADYPNELEAIFGIGELLFHANRWYGRSAREAEPYFRRASALSPDHGEYAIHLIDIALEDGRYELMDSLRPMVGSMGWPSIEVYFEELLAIRDKPVGDTTWSYGGVGRTTAFVTGHILLKTISMIEDMDAARKIVDAIIESGEFVGDDLERFVYRGAAAAGAQGQFMARADLLSSQPGLAGLQLIDRAMVYGLPVYPASESLLRDIDAELAAWDTTAVRIKVAGDSQDLHVGGYAAIKTYLRALIAMRLGDTDRVAALKSELAARADPTTGRDFAYAFLRSIDAIQAWQAGDVEAGLKAIEDGRFTMLWTDGSYSPIKAQVLDRFVMAELLASSGQLEQAQDAFGSMAAINDVTGTILLGPAYIRRAELYEQMGDETKAIEYYSRLMRMWENCDPELIPIRDDAQTQLERLLGRSVMEPE